MTNNDFNNDCQDYRSGKITFATLELKWGARAAYVI